MAANSKLKLKPFYIIVKILRDYGGIVRLESSRGCSWNKCTFCNVSHKYSNGGWRGIPVNKVLDQILEISKNGLRSIYFTDEDFFGQNYEHAESLIGGIESLLNESNINPEINYFISVNPKDVLDENCFELIKKFQKNGLREVFLGLESGCNNQLKRYCKGNSAQTNMKAVNLLRSINIEIDIGYILFDPLLSFNELEENIKFILENELFKFDSRLVKTLRIQPFSLAMNRYKDFMNDSIRIESIDYDYDFEDINVKKVFEEFNRMNLCKNRTYDIQADSRGETPNEKVRSERKLVLSKMREYEFCILEKIVEYVKLEITLIGLEEFNSDMFKKLN